MVKCLNEIGLYDLPASIDYILTKTNVSQLHYIGFSMGTTVFYIMASEKPEYQPKIRSQIFHIYPRIEFMPESRLQKLFASSTTWSHELFMKKLVVEKLLLFSICGTDTKYFNSDLLPLIMGLVPAGTSMKVMMHYSQLITKNRFGMLDYGRSGNKKHYNALEPPAYDLKSIQVSITLMYGINDLLRNTTDTMNLRKQLPKLIDAFPVDNPYCNHLDFLWSKNVKEVVNDPVRKLMDMTDDVNWVYMGPQVFDREVKITGGMFSPTLFNSVSSLDDFEENLDPIIAICMPKQYEDENDKVEFEQVRDQLRTLFLHLINFIKSSKTEDGQLPDDILTVISDWLDQAIQDIDI